MYKKTRKIKPQNCSYCVLGSNGPLHSLLQAQLRRPKLLPPQPAWTPGPQQPSHHLDSLPRPNSRHRRMAVAAAKPSDAGRAWASGGGLAMRRPAGGRRWAWGWGIRGLRLCAAVWCGGALRCIA